MRIVQKILSGSGVLGPQAESVLELKWDGKVTLEVKETINVGIVHEGGVEDVFCFYSSQCRRKFGVSNCQSPSLFTEDVTIT